VKLGAECADDGESVGFGVRSEIAEVVPGIVMKKRPVGVSALAFDIVKKSAAELTRGSDADDRGVGHLATGAQRQLPLESAEGAGGGDGALREGMLKAEEEISSDNRGTAHAAGDIRFWEGRINETDFMDGDILLLGFDGEFLANVIRPVAQFSAPENVDGRGLIGQFGADRFAGEALAQARGSGIANEEANGGIADDAHLRGAEDTAIGEEKNEDVGAEGERFSGLYVANWSSRQVIGVEAPSGIDGRIREARDSLAYGRLRRAWISWEEGRVLLGANGRGDEQNG